MNRLFNVATTESDIVDILSSMKFKKIGEGSSAHVFGDPTNNVVLKIFPPLNVVSPEDLEFINKNFILKHADLLTSKWQNFRVVKWLRQKARTIVTLSQSKNIDNVEKRNKSSNQSISGYEISVDKGLMDGLPTRVISNCVSKLPINTTNKLMRYLAQPDKIVLQKYFQEKDVLLNCLKIFAEKGDDLVCRRLIEEGVRFQVKLWRKGMTNTDMSFNMLESLLLQSDNNLQIHDVNGITDSLKVSTWYVREKEKDLSNIFNKIKEGGYPQFLYKTNCKGISESARKMYSLFPKRNRDELIMEFLEVSRSVLNEKVMLQNWGGN